MLIENIKTNNYGVIKKTEDIILKGEKISKAFPGIQALYNIDFSLKKGEVLALVGENGAGKSTLVKIISGVYSPTSGSLFLKNREIDIFDPKVAQNLGISVVYQEFPDCLHLSVTENVLLNQFPTRKLLWLDVLDKKLAQERVSSLLSELRLNIDVNEILLNLTIAQRQILEIAKAFSKGAEILIMDEPTSALAFNEIKEVFRLIGGLKDRGVSIMFISHKLNEVFEISDRIMILKDGKLANVKKISETSIKEVEKIMTGSIITGGSPQTITKKTKIVSTESKHIGKTNSLLDVRNLSKHGVFQNINFTLNQGEVLGIIGPLGAGKTEIIKSLFGLEQKDSGEIYLNGELLPKIFYPWDVIKKGMGFIPEDRRREGIFPDLSVEDNLNIVALRKDLSNRLGIRNSKKEKRLTTHFKSALNIRFSKSNIPIRNLSGGNKQKVIIGRWIGINPRVLLLDEPTCGIDVGAKEEIYSIIKHLAKEQNMGIIFVSYEPNEIFKVSNRIIGIANGGIVFQVQKNSVSIDKLHHFLVTSVFD
jgi:ribose transport system ATP-binding protein